MKKKRFENDLKEEHSIAYRQDMYAFISLVNDPTHILRAEGQEQEK